MGRGAAPTSAAYPRRPAEGIHEACGDRLIRKVNSVGTFLGTVHESTGSVRCPPVQRLCGVCDRDGLVACSEPGCLILGHPGVGPDACVRQCTCCNSWGCGAHVSPLDLLCTSCATRADVPHVHDAESYS